ncbi:MAG TPA: hypothetical protein VE712_00440, partial [Actinomycetota bacterium]|nr:hypothetical protein [Actinomycetota bacterium]
DAGSLVALTAFASVGVVVAARRPGNAIGWIFLAIGAITAVGTVAGHYARFTLAADRALAGTAVAAAIEGVGLSLGITLVVFLFLLFPQGRIDSRLRRRLVWATAVDVGVLVLSGALAPGYLPDVEPRVQNPWGIGGAAWALDAASGAANAVLVLILATAVGALLLRARRSSGVEREQLKWFGLAAAFLLVAGFIGNPLVDALPSPWDRWLRDLPFIVGFTALPIATGIAILRYRLYDIDRLINRTLVYGSLTATLLGIYALCVVVVPTVVGTGRRSDVVVAGSTLLVAALVQPVRRHIQAFIDRRFYRSRYDAQRTVEVFGGRLRNVIELEEVTTDLLRVVRGTLQPSHASLWLRSGTGAR